MESELSLGVDSVDSLRRDIESHERAMREMVSSDDWVRFVPACIELRRKKRFLRRVLS